MLPHYEGSRHSIPTEGTLRLSACLSTVLTKSYRTIHCASSSVHRIRVSPASPPRTAPSLPPLLHLSLTPPHSHFTFSHFLHSHLFYSRRHLLSLSRDTGSLTRRLRTRSVTSLADMRSVRLLARAALRFGSERSWRFLVIAHAHHIVLCRLFVVMSSSVKAAGRHTLNAACLW